MSSLAKANKESESIFQKFPIAFFKGKKYYDKVQFPISFPSRVKGMFFQPTSFQSDFTPKAKIAATVLGARL